MTLNQTYILFFVIFFSFNSFSQSSLEEIFSPYNLPYLKKSKLIQISSHDTTGGNNDRINIQVGKTATLGEIDGPAVITRIWITIDSHDSYFLRRILLRMYWDGEENPSVEVPVGDFFGTGFGYKQYASQFVGMTSGGYFCYFPMPFNKSAKIEVVNETGQEIFAFYFHLDYQMLEEPLPDNIAYFHSQWRREIRTDTSKNYTVLDAEGIGHFVGLNMSMQSYKGNLWFLEGDEMVYVDGEKYPSIYGTGTEDYFTSGWYFSEGEFSAPYHGLIMKDDSLARIAAYRFQVGDAVPFKKSILFTIEHGHANEEVADYSSTAFWYQKEPHKKFESLLPAPMRIPLRVVVPEGVLEAEDLEVKGNSERVYMFDFGPDWSGNKQLLINFTKVGEVATIKIPIPPEDRFNINLYYTLSPEYGNVDLFYLNEKVGNLSCYNNEIIPAGFVSVKDLKPENGFINLEIRSTGNEKESAGYSIGLDAFKLEPNRVFIPEWYLIGPFPNPRTSDTDRKGLDIVYPPEKEFDTTKSYIGVNDQSVVWKLTPISSTGRMTLHNKFTPYEFVVVYAQTFIYSNEERDVPLLIGTDDGAKVFLNEEELYRFLDIRISEPDQDRVILPLEKGWNSLLMKIENNFGGYAFFARVIDVEKVLTINPFERK